MYFAAQFSFTWVGTRLRSLQAKRKRARAARLTVPGFVSQQVNLGNQLEKPQRPQPEHLAELPEVVFKAILGIGKLTCEVSVG